MQYLKFLPFYFLVLLYLPNNKSQYNIQLQSGDLLFIKATNQGVSKAIDKVTAIDSTTHYSHIAMIEIDANQIWVLHAGSKNGSERITLETFINEREKGRKIDVYRLKTQFQNSIPTAIQTAKTWLGKPYNYSYVLSDEKLYCSDFIQRSFAKDSIFELDPMTFIDPETHKTGRIWVKYYQKLNLPVPEGKLGCNPNGLAASEKLVFVGTLKSM